jgi:hypothetical protein
MIGDRCWMRRCWRSSVTLHVGTSTVHFYLAKDIARGWIFDIPGRPVDLYRIFVTRCT